MRAPASAARWYAAALRVLPGSAPAEERVGLLLARAQALGATGRLDESRAALRTEPTSEPAQQSLLEAFRTKVGLLQDTIALINEMRKGNQAEAARIAEGLNKS